MRISTLSKLVGKQNMSLGVSHYLQKRSNSKRKPSFRKLLKTSNLKLNNKTKNKQFKQQNAAKKQRKEHRKLRQAISDVSTKTPQPLERYHKKPGELPNTEVLGYKFVFALCIPDLWLMDTKGIYTGGECWSSKSYFYIWYYLVWMFYDWLSA